MECTNERVGVSKKISGFTLPLGATLNMDGTALFECVVVIFLAQFFGVEMGWITQLFVVLLALLTSVGVAGIPSASLVAILVILQAVGFDDHAIATGVGMVYVVDRILDMSRTMINVLGDSQCGSHYWKKRRRDWVLSTFQFFAGVNFQLQADYSPQGDQPEAIRKLIDSVQAGNNYQTLLGVTGSGKTLTMANVIQKLQRPALIISHNKTLAAQLYSEFKSFFPHNAVEYFVSYYDYYQPEAYVPSTDTFIEKDSSINEEIERLRLATTGSLISRNDVIVVASVSCIYGLGSPDDFRALSIEISQGSEISRDELLLKLVSGLYNRNDMDLRAGRFRVRGDVVDVFPAYAQQPIRIEFWGDEIESLREFDVLTGETIRAYEQYKIYPANQYVTTREKIERACKSIEAELDERVASFEQDNLLLEAQRIRMRTEYDLEMLREIGFCNGIENYSRHLSQRKPGQRPWCLIDFFPDDFLLFIDESHVSIPQIGGMYHGDFSRKKS